jgi:alkylation response protein AidB-like acyl-CoA dehydrogenase
LTPLSAAELLETAVDPYDGAGEDERRCQGASHFLERVLPEQRSAELEARGILPEEELRAFAVEGHADTYVPREYGGAFHFPTSQRVWFRLGAHDLDTALCFGGTGLATAPLLVAATKQQAEKPFRAVLRGEMAGLALTEWKHGSDLAANEATATGLDASGRPTSVATAERFRLSGRKAPANNGSRGVFVIALLRTGAEPPFSDTLFLIDRNTPGVAPHPRFPSIGYRSMDLSGIVFEDAIVGRDAVLGEVGEGLLHTRRALEISRCGVATIAASVAANAVARAVNHARERHLYGAPIGDLGGVQLLLGSTIARALEALAACRRTSWAVARAARSARHWTSLAKLLTPRLAEECVHDAGTVLGARSLMEDLPFARLRRAAPVLAIFDGSSQLQLDEIWRRVWTWADVSSLEPGALDAHVRTPVEFDALGEDDGGLDRAHPASELTMLDRSLPSMGLATLGAASQELGVLARGLRGSPQAIRFRVSDAATRLFGVAALAEATARIGSELLHHALALRAAEAAPHVAAALVEVGAALQAPRTALVPDLLALAVGRSDRAASCLARFLDRVDTGPRLSA